MSLRHALAAALLVAALALAGCAAPAAGSAEPAPPTQMPQAQTEPPAAPPAEETDDPMEMSADTLAGTSWALSELGGAPPVAEGRPASLEFNAEGRVAGSTGCNRFMGGYSATAAELTFGPLATTMMACPGALQDQEQVFIEILTHAAAYSVADGTLTITADDGRTIVFTAA
ncbi:MAG TPA: META domain-containing protein [Chloroflexaceae bacterium]|nr:META domain-containing protein [Chloroflexaceae bacterium]